VISGRTGLHFREQTVESLMAAVECFENLTWDAKQIRANSLRFSRQVFCERMSAICMEERHGAVKA
jgi:hypothetical protein